MFLKGNSSTISYSDVHGHSRGISVSGQGNLIHHNTVHDNSDRGIYHDVSLSTETMISDNIVYNNGNGIYAGNTYGTAKLIVDGNQVYQNDGTGIEAIGLVTVADNTASDSDWGIHVDRGAVASDNVVHGNTHGIVVGGYQSSATARENLVYDNSDTGILAYYGSAVAGNTSYHNATGISGFSYGSSNIIFRGQIVNNVTYGNTDQGVLLDHAAAGTWVANNTIVQAVGDGIRVTDASEHVQLWNNIIQVDTGFAMSIASNSQSGWQSDYNLIYTPGAGQLSNWGGLTFDSRSDWFYELGLDAHSQVGETNAVDPDFVDPLNGDFHVQAGSPAVDAGDPTMDFALEPSPNGGRINVGAYGNTDQAAPSPGSLVQILSPNGWEKVRESVRNVTITWHTHGLPPALGPSDAYEASVKSDGAVAYYRLNELSGTTALDSSGERIEWNL